MRVTLEEMAGELKNVKYRTSPGAFKKLHSLSEHEKKNGKAQLPETAPVFPVIRSHSLYLCHFDLLNINFLTTFIPILYGRGLKALSASLSFSRIGISCGQCFSHFPQPMH